MTRRVRVAAVLALAALVSLAAGCNKLKARDQLNKGVQQYKAAHYEAAIDHFKNAAARSGKAASSCEAVPVIRAGEFASHDSEGAEISSTSSPTPESVPEGEDLTVLKTVIFPCYTDN